MKPNVLCKLTPDAVSLLQLISARSIAFEELGELKNSGETEPRVNGNGAHRKVRSNAGRTTVNGITLRTYRKGAKNMSRDAVLTTGQSAPSKKANGQLLDSFKVVQGEMAKDETLGIPTVSRLAATKALTKKNPTKTKGYLSGQLSYLFKYGYLREVVGKAEAA